MDSEVVPNPNPKKHQAPQNPQTEAGICSNLFFCWIFPFLWTGSRTGVEGHDIWEINSENTSKLLSDKLLRAWMNEQKQGVRSPSLAKALIRVFRNNFAFSTAMAGIKDCIFRVGQGPALGFLLAYFAGTETELHGYVAGISLILLSFLYTITHHSCNFRLVLFGMKCRIALTVLIYKKALKLSHSSLQKSSIGQMTNLLSNDVNRFDRSAMFLPYLFIGPLQTIVVTAVLWFYLGPSCLALTISLVLMAPVQSFTGKLFGKIRLKSALKTDLRVRLINEVVNGIQLIKMSTWEKPYAALVSAAREAEIYYIRKRWRLDALNQVIFDVASRFIIVLTLVTYILLGSRINAINVFVTLTLCNYLRTTITTFLPIAITAFYELRVSLERIQAFLLLEERELNSGIENQSFTSAEETCFTSPRISVDKLTASWNVDQSESCLSAISLKAEPGELLVVIGPVGSGKSSLFQAILGELRPIHGKVEVQGRLAYVSQDPWLFSGTVQENILFGRPFEAKWYSEVIEFCALSRDLKIFPFGDQTLVGEKGMIMSGGQKARINLARAVYANADVYLLDDPLSAVDAKVGRHLFEKCIRGVLKSKVVILVTHQLQYCEKASEVIMLRNGRIEARGLFEDLKSGDWGLDKDENTNFHIDQIADTDTISIFDTEQKISRSTEDVLRSEDREELERVTGRIRFNLHWNYFRSGNGLLELFVFVFLNVAAQIVLTGSDYWLKIWTQGETSSLLFNQTNSTKFESNDSIKTGDTLYYAEIYAGLVTLLFLFTLARNQSLVRVCMAASVTLHDSLFAAVLRAPMRFFEVNSAGRVNNRLVNDVGNIDDALPRFYSAALNNAFQMLGAMTVVSIVQPVMILPTLIQLVLFIFIRNFYMRTSSTLKRLEAVSRSPVFAHLSTTLQGLTTIRAFRAERTLEAQFDSFQDTHSAALYYYFAASRWFTMVLDCIANVYVAVLVISYLIWSAESSSVGLAVASALNLTLICSFGVAQSAELDNQMVSVERVNEYSAIQPEGDFDTQGKKPDESWATKGKIEMKSVVVQYGDDPPVLRGISLLINPKEKIGIVGRTGAGKSTIISSLFRLVQPSSGSVNIDGLDISNLGLHDVRSKITIIPQNPILFSGTIRKNLDAFDKHTDEELWRVLGEVNLVSRVRQLSAAGLDSEVAQGGSNFSSGERQLLCLARAILSQTSILVLDEATASVDPKTDAMIQRTVTEKFKSCTVLTIAHRLDTVMGSDRICVIDAGRIVEFDEPHILLKNSSGGLFQLVQQTGKAGQTHLTQLARKAYEERRNEPNKTVTLDVDGNLQSSINAGILNN